MTVAEVVERAARDIPQDFAGQPEVEAAVRHTVARTSQALGLNAQAAAQATAALAIRETALGPDHPDTLAAVFVLASAQRVLGHYPEAEALYRRAWLGRLRVLGTEHPDTLAAQAGLALAVFDLDQRAEAELLQRSLVEVAARVLGPDHLDTLGGNSTLAHILEARGEVTEAEALLRDTLARKQRTLGPEHPGTLDTMHTLAILLQNAAPPRPVGALHARGAGGAHTRARPRPSRYAGRRREPGAAGAPAGQALRGRGADAAGRGRVRPAAGRPARDDAQQHEQPGHGALAPETLRGSGAVAAAGLAAPRRIRCRPATGGRSCSSATWDRRSWGWDALDEAEEHLMASYRALLAAFGPLHRRTTSAAGQLAILYEARGLPR